MSSEVDMRNRRKGAGSKPVASRGRKDGDSTFVNRELSKDELADYRSWRSNVDDVDLVWREAVDSGYKFTVRYDDRNNCSVAFMFPDDGGDNFGFILTGRGGTPYRAVSECLYKHHVLFGGAWFEASSGPSGPNDPDW